jgi:hypothetical protein
MVYAPFSDLHPGLIRNLDVVSLGHHTKTPCHFDKGTCPVFSHLAHNSQASGRPRLIEATIHLGSHHNQVDGAFHFNYGLIHPIKLYGCPQPQIRTRW